MSVSSPDEYEASYHTAIDGHARQALDRATKSKSRTCVYHVWVRDLKLGQSRPQTQYGVLGRARTCLPQVQKEDR